ncbi:MAG: 30S ribosomal protein S18 [Actinobacteria bacterium]|jgi:small subunit ribosomal protein S18|nr:30S ribosomal protein S18 [Actinomycetota bacterium]
MSSKKNKTRSPKEANPKKIKKKTSVLVTDKVEYIDYKDVNLLTRFVSDRSKIRNRRVTGNTVQQQREIANAIKNCREMALMPYTKRVAQTRTGRGGRDGERGERGPRADRDQVQQAQVEGTEVEELEIDEIETTDAETEEA